MSGSAKNATAMPARTSTGNGHADAARPGAGRARHGARNPYEARICLALLAGDEVDERLRAIGVRRVLGDGDRVLGDHVDVGRDLDAVGVVAGGDDVGDVHDAGVGLAQRSPW